MNLVKLNEEISFDPTPKLKSSPVPILFVSFNEYDNKCFHCRERYTHTLTYNLKYCKKCLSCYLINITDNNMYLDVYLLRKDLESNEHEISKTKVSQNIQECYGNCLRIIFFKQICGRYDYFLDLSTEIKNVIESERYCKLCGKLLYQGADFNIMKEFKLCSNCYLISSGCIKSTLTKKLIYLPWWYTAYECFCNEKLAFTSNCQKYCNNCFTFFIGCRYCLTTNIIFGITNQSQCKKCKRISTIILDITKIISINSGNSVLDDFLVSIRSYQLEITKFTDVMKNIDKYFVPSQIFHILSKDMLSSTIMIKYTPYSRFTNVKEIAKGGFSIIYQATWLDSSKNNGFINFNMSEMNNQIVVLKRFKNPQYAKKYFFNEVNSCNIRIFCKIF
jgi:hypothetical protein